MGKKFIKECLLKINHQMNKCKKSTNKLYITKKPMYLLNGIY